MIRIRKQVTRYALLLVFEYRQTATASDAPNPLLAMRTDLKLGYELARTRFQIKPENITVVTDLKSQKGVSNPWDPLNEDPLKNPRVVRLPCPDVTVICREIAQFVENFVRGVREVSKGSEITHEVFVYISGHGAQIPNPHCHDDNPEEMDNALIFTSEDGRFRKYLRDDDIFRILFGQIEVRADGTMTVPIAVRKTKTDRGGSLYYSFSDESITFKITPHAYNRKKIVNSDGCYDEKHVEATSPNGEHVFLSDRGLPVSTGMLAIIDTCHSGTMTDFHYIYNPQTNRMELTRRAPSSRYAFPLCVCLAAAQDKSEAPSTSNGSTFTRYIYQLFNQQPGTVSISDLHKLIYSRLPALLRKCKPTITGTIEDHEYLLPLLHPIDDPVQQQQTTDFEYGTDEDLYGTVETSTSYGGYKGSEDYKLSVFPTDQLPLPPDVGVKSEHTPALTFKPPRTPSKVPYTPPKIRTPSKISSTPPKLHSRPVTPVPSTPPKLHPNTPVKVPTPKPSPPPRAPSKSGSPAKPKPQVVSEPPPKSPDLVSILDISD